MPKRKYIRWSLLEHDPQIKQDSIEWLAKRQDIVLTFTAKGIFVSGHFNTFCGIGPETLISWDEIDAYKRELK